MEFEAEPIEMLFWRALALITLACVLAPLARRAGLGAILGYLAAGVVVQFLFADSFAEHPEELMHFAEFGIVLFLFVIGLELRPSTLWSMRGDIFGLGLAQMLVCAFALALPAALIGLTPAAAMVAGLGLALSSTALVMQMLQERGEQSSPHGRKAFAVLLFQDLAIVPLLLLVSLIGPASQADGSWLDALNGLGVALVAIAVLIVVGRYGLDPMFRILSRTRLTELMTAAALGVVIASAGLMSLAGMSYAMGAFIAGVMLAGSSFRRELQANVEPFRGLFLALFFITVGLTLDLQAVRNNWLLIVVGAPVAMALKAAAIYGVARVFRHEHALSVRVALALPQHGEFGFVLFAAAATAGLFGIEISSALIALIAASMALSPLASRLTPLLLPTQRAAPMEADYTEANGSILIIGFGRFGQIVSQPLFAAGCDLVILDANADRVRDAERFGFTVFYGDGSRREVLRACAEDGLKLIAVCVDDRESADEIVETVTDIFPDIELVVRAYDRGHAIDLKRAGVKHWVRETSGSAYAMGRMALAQIGLPDRRADEILDDVRARDAARLEDQAEGDATSGLDRLHRHPVRPEPLDPPRGQEPRR